METILNNINSLGGFELNLLASTTFLIATLVARYLFKKVSSSSKLFIKLYENMYFYKYVAHKNIYELSEIPEQVKFFFQTCLMCLKWLILSLMVLLFFHGVSALTSGNWFLLVGYWISFNYMLEAYMWARDSRNDKTAKAIHQERISSNSSTESS
ncbi:MAG: hypothetical protein CMP91_11580 [Gammaproteobacteria bacterium]|nr:hypothetical protein [Gammaproteobacteria bacterium]|tara:strand:- start:65187 stop:65651 length:465 start_codon:yes stop_codon:yes gene_type:complete